MKAAYPILMQRGSDYIVVSIPDFQIGTQGTDEADAMEMARDAIGLVGIDMEDDGELLPVPSPLSSVRPENADDIITLVDVDFDEYRRKNSQRTVRRNVSLPAWLDAAARDAGINVSAVLARALQQELHLSS